MKPQQTDNSAGTFFRWLVNHPKKVIFTGLVFMLAMGSFIPDLTKDTRADAFLADDNPALVYREKAKSLFGLSDPMVIAIVAPDNIFTIEGLMRIDRMVCRGEGGYLACHLQCFRGCRRIFRMCFAMIMNLSHPASHVAFSTLHFS